MNSNQADVEYVRRARRLRATLGNQTARLHRALREISPPAQQVMQLAPAPISRAESFAHIVAGQLQGDILRYSARLSLLRQADRMGIERFEANLIIAAVQHRAAAVEPQLPAPHKPFTAARAAILIAIAEALMMAAFYWHGSF